MSDFRLWLARLICPKGWEIHPKGDMNTIVKWNVGGNLTFILPKGKHVHSNPVRKQRIET
jgi:hypothetical protein